jgi:hypothetical protein
MVQPAPPELAASAAAAPPFEWPVSTRMRYLLTGNVRGEVSGQAQVEWIRVGQRYQVHLDVIVGMKIAPLGSRRMSSDGDITPEGLAPRRYDQETKLAFNDPSARRCVSKATACCCPTAPWCRAGRARKTPRASSCNSATCLRRSPTGCAPATASRSRSPCRATSRAGSTTCSKKQDRRDHAQPPQAAQRAERRADGRARRRAQGLRRRRGIGCIVITGSEKAFAAGADIAAMAKWSYMDVYKRRLHHPQLGDDPLHPQAGDRRGGRLRARRRLRARDDVRHHHRRRHRQVRPARDQARRHPRRRRHAAPAARVGKAKAMDMVLTAA